MTGCDAFQIDCERRNQGALGPAEVAALDMHLSGCAECRGFDEVTRRLDVMMQANAEHAVGTIDWEQLRARVERLKVNTRSHLLALAAGLVASAVIRALESGHGVWHVASSLFRSLIVLAPIALIYARRLDSEIDRARANQGELFEVLRRELDRRLGLLWIVVVVFPLFAVWSLATGFDGGLSAPVIVDAAFDVTAIGFAIYTYLVWLPRARTLRMAHRVRSRRPRDAEPIDPEQPSPAMTAPAPAHEELGLVRRALGAVSAESRAVLALFAIEGLSHKEVAAILGVPEGTVWSRLHKAKKAMAAELARLEAA